MTNPLTPTEREELRRLTDHRSGPDEERGTIALAALPRLLDALDSAERERDEARAEVDRLSQQACDECDGSGEYTIDGEPHPCVCVGETEAYQRLVAERDRLSEALRKLLLSRDVTWEQTGAGHDWPEAVEDAIEALEPTP